MTLSMLQRRQALRWLLAPGMAGLLPARMALAAPALRPDGPRLVLVMLRGALDGLAAVPATGDPAWAALRPATDGPGGATGTPAGLPLGDPFSLHPALAQLHRWYTEGQLLVLHAVGSPYRERSHFDAQQMLESGGERPFVLSTGWLGRALQAAGQGGVALTSAMPLALRGADAASTWTPSRSLGSRDDLLARVAELYRDDALLRQAFAQSQAQQGMAGAAAGSDNSMVSLARQAGSFLAAAQGPRVAWLEADGWDTHTQQIGRLGRQLSALDSGLAALREGLGDHWARTTVLVMTEFGRSAAFNGSGGTDHGTGGVAFLAGGQVDGGRVLADWPGLAPGQLLDGRDLRPTLDLRSVLASLAQRQFGLGQAVLSGTVLPGAAPLRQTLWRA
jgi:uncharacterized protein (DUF1501 family)